MVLVGEYRMSVRKNKRKLAHQTNSPWADQRICDELERLYALTGREYMSNLDIAEALNRKFDQDFTRSAIVSRARLQGLPAKYPHRSAHAPGGARQVNKVREQRRVAGAKTSTLPGFNSGALVRDMKAKAKGAEQPPAPPEPVFETPEGGIPLLQAKQNECRWPMADSPEHGAMCCGKQVTNRPNGRPHVYCIEHARIGVDRQRTYAAEARSQSDADNYGKRRQSRIGLLNRFR